MTQGSPPFEGVGVALVTLFDDSGAVDYEATAAHAVALAGLGIQAVVVAGTTGEADALTDPERIGLFTAVRKALPDVPVIAGTGGGSAADAATLTEAAVAAGVDAVLTRSPRGVDDPTDYYQTVAGAAGDVTLLAYHFPAVSPPGISLDVLTRLPVQGCKDSSGDMGRLLATLDRWDGWLYPGSPTLLLAAGQLGCTGAILALANAEPELCLEAFGGSPQAQRQLIRGHLAAAQNPPRGIKRLAAKRFGTSEYARMAASER